MRALPILLTSLLLPFRTQAGEAASPSLRCEALFHSSFLQHDDPLAQVAEAFRRTLEGPASNLLTLSQLEALLGRGELNPAPMRSDWNHIAETLSAIRRFSKARGIGDAATREAFEKVLRELIERRSKAAAATMEARALGAMAKQSTLSASVRSDLGQLLGAFPKSNLVIAGRPTTQGLTEYLVLDASDLTTVKYKLDAKESRLNLAPIEKIAVSSSEKFALGVDGSGVYVWSLSSGQLIQQLRRAELSAGFEPITAIQVSPSGRYLAFGFDRTGQVMTEIAVYDRNMNRVIKKKISGKSIADIYFNAGEESLLVLDESGGLKEHPLPSLGMLKDPNYIELPGESRTLPTISADGELLVRIARDPATGNEVGQLVHIDTGEVRGQFPCPNSLQKQQLLVSALSISPDNRYIGLGGTRLAAKSWVYDTVTESLIELKGQTLFPGKLHFDAASSSVYLQIQARDLANASGTPASLTGWKLTTIQ